MVLAANAYYRQLKTSGVNSNVNGDYDPDNLAFGGLQRPVRCEHESMGRLGTADDPARMGRDRAPNRRRAPPSMAAPRRLRKRNRRRPSSATARPSAPDLSTTETDVDTRVGYAGIYLADSISLTPQWTLVLSGRYNTARITTTDLTRGCARHRRHQHVPPLQSGHRRHVGAERGDQRVRQHQPGHARSHARRAHLRRPERSVHAAEHLRRRPAAATGDRDNLRGRRARPRRRHGVLQCRDLPDGSSQRHPVHRRGQRRRQCRIFSERRQYAPAGDRAHRRRRIRRVLARRPLHIPRRDVRNGVRGKQPQQFDRQCRRTDPGATRQPHCPGCRETRCGCAAIGRGGHSRPALRCSRSVPSTRAATRTTATSTGRCQGMPWSRWMGRGRSIAIGKCLRASTICSARPIRTSAFWDRTIFVVPGTLSTRRSQDPSSSGRRGHRSAPGSAFDTGSTALPATAKLGRRAGRAPMTAQPNTLTRRRWLHLLAAGSASALLPASWPASRAAAQGARDGCATDGAFTQPLYVPGTNGWLARLDVGPAPLAMRARTA